MIFILHTPNQLLIRNKKRGHCIYDNLMFFEKTMCVMMTWCKKMLSKGVWSSSQINDLRSVHDLNKDLLKKTLMSCCCRKEMLKIKHKNQFVTDDFAKKIGLSICYTVKLPNSTTKSVA